MTTFVAVVLAIFGIGAVAVGGATVTGQQERLCTALGGTWTPGPFGSNVCPGGHLIPREPRQ